MTREGWICPTCKRGLSPDQPHCDHDASTVVPRLPLRRGTTTPWMPQPATIDEYTRLIGGCEACRESGICGCYRPDRDSVTC